MAVVPSLVGILRRAPLRRARLGGDNDELRILCQDIGVDAGGIDVQRTERTYVDLLHLFGEVERFSENTFVGGIEIAGIIDNNIQSYAIRLHLLTRVVDCLLIRYVNTFVHVRLTNKIIKVVVGTSTGNDRSGTIGNQYLGYFKAEATVATCHKYRLVLESTSVEDAVNIQVALIVLGLGIGKSLLLVGDRIRAASGLVKVSRVSHGSFFRTCIVPEDGPSEDLSAVYLLVPVSGTVPAVAGSGRAVGYLRILLLLLPRARTRRRCGLFQVFLGWIRWRFEARSSKVARE
mmetsp:Transcript_776/g.1195  ORF Transcript_776/g.1195 Transcript_776/m.1195 type:complete len:290 (+) Transcript_776:293-1162(+)